jgi:glycerate 2-kinase
MEFNIKNNFLNDKNEKTLYKILSAALQAAEPFKTVSSVLDFDGDFLRVSGLEKNFPIKHRVHLIGAGKASIPMACGVVAVLGANVTSGIIITKEDLEQTNLSLPKQIEIVKGNHPIPGEDSLRSTEMLIHSCRGLSPEDLVICLISGGGSALMTLPYDDVRLEDIQGLTLELLNCGATIGEINTIRKHLDRVKGGGLARICSPAFVLTLAISDVIGSPPAVIASGPTVADESTYEDAFQIIQKYYLQKTLPISIIETLKAGLNEQIPETLKPGDPVFDRCFYKLVASNEISVGAALNAAAGEGFQTVNLGSQIQGEANVIGKEMAERLIAASQSNQGSQKPLCLIGGGETTVRMKGDGLGGRNLEFALAAVKPLAGIRNICLVTLATDGEDGPTDTAGAIVTGGTYQNGKAVGCDPERFLAGNDSYHYFDRVGGVIRTGSTGTNVMDMIFIFSF